MCTYNSTPVLAINLLVLSVKVPTLRLKITVFIGPEFIIVNKNNKNKEYVPTICILALHKMHKIILH
jgi:hypothetical protein